MSNNEDRYKKTIALAIKKIFENRKKQQKFIPGKTWIQYAGGVFDDNEINASVDVLIEGWFGLGKKAAEFETNLAKYAGTKGAIITNSGSSSNFLAVASLMTNMLPDHLSPGDEVITSACGFPTTVNPLFTHGLTPVFLDIDPQTYNLKASDLEKALTKKTRLVMIAHTLGNPNEMDKIVEFCRKNKLYLIEDNCDGLGSTYKNKKTGSFGVLATQSFYPPHHITMGEGGAVLYNDVRFEIITRSLRDWGRACWCKGDEKRTLGACGVRFNFKINGRPYDHKYIFNQIGYNLKPIEPQAAMGVVQLKRMPAFAEKRRHNFKRLMNYAKNWEKFFILPKAQEFSDPCWFSFPLTIKDEVKFNRNDIAKFLEERMIQTRPLFAGNITRQPAYSKAKYRTVGKLTNADRVLYNTFFVGVYPGIDDARIDYIAESIEKFIKPY